MTGVEMTGRVPTRRRRPSPPQLVVAAFVLLLAAWVGANPPFASPDEPAHYVRALAVASGQLRGSPTEYTKEQLSGAEDRVVTWMSSTGRAFDIPDRLAALPTPSCFAFQPDQSAACLRREPRSPPVMRSYVGSYQPFLYAPPGVIARLGRSPVSALFLGRVVDAALAAALLAMGAFALWSASSGPWSLVGLLLAATPMALFLGASLSPNGSEVAAGICFFATLMRLSRPGEASEGPPKWLWAALAVSGVVLATSRSLGPLFVALALGVWIATFGPRPAWRRWRNGRHAAIAATAAIAIAAAVGGLWELLVQPHPDRPRLTAHLVGSTARLWPKFLEEQIGLFGWLDTVLPGWATKSWMVMVFLVVALALVFGSGRRRLVLGAVIVVVAVSTVGFAVLVTNTGFGFQGRYVLALVVVVPLYGGEVLHDAASRMKGAWSKGAWSGRALRWLPLVVAVGVALVQLTAWYFNARRYAVGAHGRRLFLLSPAWSPALGWWPWLVIAIVGSGLLVVAALPTRIDDSLAAAPAEVAG